MYPAKAGEGETVQQFTEVFHHVIALGFAVHQHIQLHFFLVANAAGNFFLHLLMVVGVDQLAGFPVPASSANFPGLRERADGGGGEGGQLQGLLLPGNTGGKRAEAVAGNLAGVCQALGNGRVVNSRGQATGLQGCPLGVQAGIDAAVATEGATEQRQLFQFLLGKTQPAFQFAIELVFLVQIHRAMQQGTGRRQPELTAQFIAQANQAIQGGVQIGAPDVATVDYPQR